MLHSLVPAAVSYQNVFGDQIAWIIPTTFLLSLVWAFSSIFAVVERIKTWPGPSRMMPKRGEILLWMVSVSSVVAIGGIMAFGTTHYPGIETNMNADLKAKYGATIADNTLTLPENIDDLSQVHEYQLVGPDGKTGTLAFKWDRATSEPTIVSDPTLPVLNSAAK